MSAALSERLERVVGYPPLSELSELQRRELHEALLEADTFEDLPGKWQAAIMEAEQTGRSFGVCGERSGWPAAVARTRRFPHAQAGNSAWVRMYHI